MRITASGRFNFSGDYVQAVSDFTYIGKTSFYAKVRFRTQKDYPFAGVGGHGAVVFSGDEYGNAVGQLMYVIGVAGSTPVEGLRWYVGQSTTLARVQAGEGGRMEFIGPFGSEGGVYLDVQGGVLYEAKDRSIRPSRGWQLEGAIRFAGSIIGDNAEELSRRERSSFIGGWFIEVIRWQPIYKDWLVLGIRGLFDHTLGARPFYDQNRLGGMLRDELGNGQHFTG